MTQTFDQVKSLLDLQLDDIAEGLTERLNLEPHPAVMLKLNADGDTEVVHFEFQGIPTDRTRYSGYNHPVEIEFRFHDGNLDYGYAHFGTEAANVQDGGNVYYTLKAIRGELNGRPISVSEIMEQLKTEVGHYMERGNDMIDMLSELRSDVHADMKQRFPKRTSRLVRSLDHANDISVEFAIDNVVHDFDISYDIPDRIAKVGSVKIPIEPEWARDEIAQNLKEPIREAMTHKILQSHDVQSMGYDDTEIGHKFKQIHQAAIDVLALSKDNVKRKWNPLEIEQDGSQLTIHCGDYHPHRQSTDDREFSIAFDAETDNALITITRGFRASKPKEYPVHVDFENIRALSDTVFDKLDLGIARADTLLDDLEQDGPQL